MESLNIERYDDCVICGKRPTYFSFRVGVLCDDCWTSLKKIPKHIPDEQTFKYLELREKGR